MSTRVMRSLSFSHMAYWRTVSDKLWTRWLPPETLDKSFREEGHPAAVFKPLDRVLLPEFLRFGSLTRPELVSSRPAVEFAISQTAVTAWMEAARRRSLITRRADTADAEGRTLPHPEWDITPDGRDAYQKARWQAAVNAAWRTMRVAVPLAAAIFTIVKFLLGDDVIPDKGLIDDIRLSSVWRSDLGPALMGMLAGGLPQVIVYPFLAAGRRRHVVRHASRFLDETPRSIN